MNLKIVHHQSVEITEPPSTLIKHSKYKQFISRKYTSATSNLHFTISSPELIVAVLVISEGRESSFPSFQVFEVVKGLRVHWSQERE